MIQELFPDILMLEPVRTFHIFLRAVRWLNMWPIPEITCQEEEEDAAEDAVEEAEEGGPGIWTGMGW
jgi:hypothetical protein